MNSYGYEEEEKDISIISVLSWLSIWFIRIGVVIGIIVFLYFIVTGKILTALLYVLGLVLAYFFGYFFVFLLDKLIMLH